MKFLKDIVWSNFFVRALFLSNFLKSLVQKKNFGLISQVVFELEYLFKEAVVQRCSVKKVFLEISQNSQENTCVFY